MQFVWEKQPWTVGRARDVLLLELFNPDKNPADYKFQYLHTSVRFYGLPLELRKVYIVNYLINEIGQPSDFEKLRSTSLFNDPEYVTAKVKLDITAQAKDRVRFWSDTNSYIYVYVHYEKINRICTYCAGFFHNADHCRQRRAKLMQAEAAMESHPTPFENFGPWMTLITAIPRDLMQKQLQSMTNTERTSDQLRQLRLGFSVLSTDDAGKTELLIQAAEKNQEVQKKTMHQGVNDEPLLQNPHSTSPGDANKAVNLSL